MQNRETKLQMTGLKIWIIQEEKLNFKIKVNMIMLL